MSRKNEQGSEEITIAILIVVAIALVIFGTWSAISWQSRRDSFGRECIAAHGVVQQNGFNRIDCFSVEDGKLIKIPSGNY